MRNIVEEGVHFKKPFEWVENVLSPEKAIDIQNKLGSDIMMSFDECPPFDESYDYVKNRWNGRLAGGRGLKAHANPDRQGLFGIIQGAGFEDLRKQSAQDLISMDFQGIPSEACQLANQSGNESRVGIYDSLDSRK